MLRSDASLLACALSLAALLASPSALAQSTTSIQAPSVDQRLRAASAHFDAQDFEGALRLFQQLYVETQDPPLLLNIGTCLERMGRPREALSALRRYVDLDPTSPARRSTDALIARIEASQTAAPPVHSQPALPPPPSRPVVAPTVTVAPRPTLVAPWVLVGLGAAAIVAAPVLFFAVRAPALSRIPTECSLDTGVCPTSVDLGPVNANADAARAATIGAGVSLGVGLAALSAGVAWGVLSSRESNTVRVGVAPTQGGAMTSIGGRF